MTHYTRKLLKQAYAVSDFLDIFDFLGWKSIPKRAFPTKTFEFIVALFPGKANPQMSAVRSGNDALGC
jgi:hypothetical protein